MLLPELVPAIHRQWARTGVNTYGWINLEEAAAAAAAEVEEDEDEEERSKQIARYSYSPASQRHTTRTAPYTASCKDLVPAGNLVMPHEEEEEREVVEEVVEVEGSRAARV